MDFTDVEQRAVRRHAGAADFDRWLTLFTPDDLDDLWAEYGDVRLMAAEILTSLASPTLEGLRKLGDVTVDRKGQMAAYLERAKILRAEAMAQRGLMGPIIAPWGVEC